MDVVVASTDELALALPRSEGELNLFPVALQNGNEQVGGLQRREQSALGSLFAGRRGSKSGA